MPAPPPAAAAHTIRVCGEDIGTLVVSRLEHGLNVSLAVRHAGRLHAVDFMVDDADAERRLTRRTYRVSRRRTIERLPW